MDLKEFKKKRFTGYEEIECYPNGFDNYCVACMLLAVDFEQELFKLIPIPDGFYEEIPFWCRAEYCKRPSRKTEMKIKYKSGTRDIFPSKKKL